MAELYCAYCRTFKKAAGFKTLVHRESGTQRRMCPTCASRRTLPRDVLQEMADQTKKKGST